jgi:hypothetical protein
VSAEEQNRWGWDYIQRTYGPPEAVSVISVTSGGPRLVAAADGTLVTPDHLCPDLLRWENIGAADGLRGRVVRAFFWLLRAWPA